MKFQTVYTKTGTSDDAAPTNGAAAPTGSFGLDSYVDPSRLTPVGSIDVYAELLDGAGADIAGAYWTAQLWRQDSDNGRWNTVGAPFRLSAGVESHVPVPSPNMPGGRLYLQLTGASGAPTTTRVHVAPSGALSSTEATQLANKAFLAEIADDLPAKGPANANAAMPVTLATNDAQAAALLAQLTQIAAEVSPLAAAPPGIVRTTVGTTAATLASAPCSRGFWLVCHYDSPGVLWYGAASAGVTSSGSNARGHLVPGDRKWFGLDNPSRLEVCGSAAATAYSIDGE